MCRLLVWADSTKQWLVPCSDNTSSMSGFAGWMKITASLNCCLFFLICYDSEWKDLVPGFPSATPRLPAQSSSLLPPILSLSVSYFVTQFVYPFEFSCFPSITPDCFQTLVISPNPSQPILLFHSVLFPPACYLASVSSSTLGLQWCYTFLLNPTPCDAHAIPGPLASL